MNLGTFTQRHAVVDVGTNSVKLLVADAGFGLQPVLKLSRRTSLGEGCFRTGRLQQDAIARTVAAVAEVVVRAELLRPSSIRIVATCATREASNGSELVQAIFRATGLSVEILSGDEEAEYVFRGVMSDPAIGRGPVLIVDVGGGSTEWVVGEAGVAHFAASTRLGTARLLEMMPPSDPPTSGQLARCRRAVAEYLGHAVRPRLRPVLAAFCGRPVSVVGLGGACKALTRLASEASSGVAGPGVLCAELIGAQVESLWRLSAQERRELSGLEPEKADVILAGAVIFEAVMQQFDFARLLHTGHGLRTGVLMTSLIKGTKLSARTEPQGAGTRLPGMLDRPVTPAAAARPRA